MSIRIAAAGDVHIREANRKQLTDAQAANYTPQKYLAGTDGWNPIS